MFKITKYIKLRNCFPQLRRLRHSCEKECPPRYECKQPEPSENEQYIKEFKEKSIPNILRPHSHKDYRIYKNIFLFVCLPICFGVFFNIFYLNPEEFSRPKFLPFAHLRIRRKPFPWDPVRTLFHNPKINALPDGYEVEVPEEQELDPFELKK